MLSSILSFILAWYNLPFTFLLAVCLLLAALQWVGLGGDHDSDADLDHGLDHDVDLDHGLDHDVDLDHSLDHDVDLDHGLDHDIDHDVDHDVDHDADADHTVESGFSILAYLGVGRAPLLVTLLLLFGSVGLIGWLFNGLVIQSLGSYPGLVMIAALVVSLGIGSFISSRIARAIGRALPPLSTTATPARAMVGRRGTVISPFVDPRYGMVHLRDAGGTLISVFAVAMEEPTIRRGEEVILTDYDAEKRIYTVVRANK
jgi:membrane protein implicated in regulation of membrane protease activity